MSGTGSFEWMIASLVPAQELEGNSATGTRTRVARVRAEYPNQLDYSGLDAARREP